jgi:replicative DNA helicase
MSQHRLPPQNIEAEMSVIGASLLSQDCYDKARRIAKPSDFYREQNQIIFEAMGTMEETIDILTLCNNLKKQSQLDKVGGPAYIATVCDSVIPSVSMVARAAEMVRECSRRREFISEASEMVEECYGGGDFSETVSSLEKRAFALSENIGNSNESKSLGEIGFEVFQKIDRINKGEILPGLMTGYDSIDNMTTGLQGGDLVYLAGRPSMGKTALAMNIARRIGDQKIPIGVFSLEMSSESLGMRMISEISKVNGMALKSGFIRDNQWPMLAKAAGYMKDLPIHVDDTPALHISEIRSRARMMHRRHGIKLIVLDYLQLARGDGDSREQVISSISSGLKAMAKELNIPVIALSQLNRGLENRPDKRPKLSDLRESGSLEQDGDIIIFIYRDEVYNKDDNNPNKGIAEIIFGKQRNGPTGTVKMAWLESITSFEELARE